MDILVTGAAGFIGSSLMYKLAKRGDNVLGVDCINDYYDVKLKFARLKESGFSREDIEHETEETSSSLFPNCRFLKAGIDNREAMDRLFSRHSFDVVVNLAAQAGVRYSIQNPYAYLQSNMAGFLNLLECCRHHNVQTLVFASSSSVYGMRQDVPYKESDFTDRPVSLYAASKKSDELMAYSYSNLYGITTVGLRYFTVYGPWGRPDMAPMLFADAILNDRGMKLFNNGDMLRDFTYIDDIVEGTLRVIDCYEAKEKPSDTVPAQIYNIGCSQPVKLMDFVSELEHAFGRQTSKEFLPMQPGDVYQTYSDTGKLEKETGFKPRTTLHDGVARFAAWYMSDKNPLR